MHSEYFNYIKVEQIKLLERLGLDSDHAEIQLYVEQANVMQAVLQLYKATLLRHESIPEEKNETSYSREKKNTDLNRLFLKKEWTIKNRDAKRESNLTEELLDVYKFARLLVGGELANIKAYIPEEVVRKHDIEHGDMVKVYPIGELPNGRIKYAYTIEEKLGEEPPKSRRQFNYCLVEKSASKLICKSNKDGVFREDDIFPIFHISEADSFKHNLSPGDIVDIAIENNDWQKGKVVWKHEIKSNQAQQKRKV